MSAITINRDRLHKIFMDTLAIYSPSGKERQAQEVADSFLSQHGLKTIRQPLDEYRYNIIVLPEDGEPEWGMVGHMDTVPAYNMEVLEPWSEDDSKSGDEWIYGLGAADMKGGCVAMMEAFVVAHEQGIKNRGALFLVVGEEEEGDGTQAVMNEYSLPWALVTEPTGMRPCLEHYGFIEIELNTSGIRRHASCAGREHNAVQNMLRLLVTLSEHFENLRSDVVFNIRDMHSSEAGFAVPDHCSAWIDLHVPPRSPLGEITAEVEDVTRRICTSEGIEPYPISFNTLYSGYSLPESGAFQELLKEVYEKDGQRTWNPMPFKSHSDANLLWGGGTRSIILGPGELSRAHTRDEAVDFSQVLAASQYYLDFIAASAEGLYASGNPQ